LVWPGVLQCVLQSITYVLQCILQYVVQCVLQCILQCMLQCILQSVGPAKVGHLVRPGWWPGEFIYSPTLHCTALHCTALHCTAREPGRASWWRPPLLLCCFREPGSGRAPLQGRGQAGLLPCPALPCFALPFPYFTSLPFPSLPSRYADMDSVEFF
jgi:hypothetical protein